MANEFQSRRGKGVSGGGREGGRERGMEGREGRTSLCEGVTGDQGSGAGGGHP